MDSIANVSEMANLKVNNFSNEKSVLWHFGKKIQLLSWCGNLICV